MTSERSNDLVSAVVLPGQFTRGSHGRFGPCRLVAVTRRIVVDGYRVKYGRKPHDGVVVVVTTNVPDDKLTAEEWEAIQ